MFTSMHNIHGFGSVTFYPADPDHLDTDTPKSHQIQAANLSRTLLLTGIRDYGNILSKQCKTIRNQFLVLGRI